MDVARQVINYKDEDFVEKVKELTDGRGADVIYGTPCVLCTFSWLMKPTLLTLMSLIPLWSDPVGGEVFDKSTKVIAWGGRTFTHSLHQTSASL